MSQTMIAVTIGVGPHFAPLAQMAAASCAACTGLPVSILGEEAMTRHGLKVPNHLKFRLFEEFPEAETILLFDADIIFLRQWDVRQFAGAGEFICVRDLSDKEWITSDARNIGIPAGDYFNGGFFIVNRTHHASMLRLAGELQGRIHATFIDQTELNAARAWLHLPTRYLPIAYNYLVTDENGSPDTESITVLHLLRLAKKPHLTQQRYHQYWKSDPITDSPALREAQRRILSTGFTYERIGYDERPIHLGSDGTLTEGSAVCETHWRLTEEEGRPVLWLGNRHLPICALEEDTHGIWHGQWLRWEQMPIRLAPVRDIQSRTKIEGKINHVD